MSDCFEVLSGNKNDGQFAYEIGLVIFVVSIVPDTNRAPIQLSSEFRFGISFF